MRQFGISVNGLVLLALLMTGPTAQAASCCGGGGGTSLIFGDFDKTFSAEVKRGSVIGDVSPQGESVFRHSKNSEVSESVNLRAAMMMSEDFQTGGSVSLIRRARQLGRSEAESAGLGDATLFGAYEWWPERTYSAWRPRGFVYLRTTIPLAPSIYDFEENLAADARGQGLFLMAIGVPFHKVRGRWDWTVTPELETGFEREFMSSTGSRTVVRPGWTSSLALSGGWSVAGAEAWRVGASVTPRYESGKLVNGQELSPRSVWTTGASVHWSWVPAYSVGMTYSDQTLIGPAQNTTLERSAALSFEMRESL